MTKPRRARLIPGSPAAAIGLAIVVLACWLALSSPSALAATGPNNAHDAGHAPAHAARMMHATDEAHLLYIRSRSAGSHLFEEGTAHGTLPGSVIAKCNLGATFVANVTISTRTGIIRGHGTATPHASGIYESFSGTLTITGGTGRYAHAHGHAGLYGVFNRRTYNLIVQTTGSFSY
ncbi:MAG TPA: hypothetical protein VNX67_05725 [Solirubrobacteraceae bacterium]|jgi:hypothetical protein|nr:hypothetical protein [Solirubrobacteraceae bacterium]